MYKVVKISLLFLLFAPVCLMAQSEFLDNEKFGVGLSVGLYKYEGSLGAYDYGAGASILSYFNVGVNHIIFNTEFNNDYVTSFRVEAIPLKSKGNPRAILGVGISYSDYDKRNHYTGGFLFGVRYRSKPTLFIQPMVLLSCTDARDNYHFGATLAFAIVNQGEGIRLVVTPSISSVEGDFSFGVSLGVVITGKSHSTGAS